MIVKRKKVHPPEKDEPKVENVEYWTRDKKGKARRSLPYRHVAFTEDEVLICD